MFKKNQFLVISVLVHIVVIYVLAQSIMFPSVSEDKSEPVLQATLWYESPPLVKEPILEEVKQSPLPPPEVETVEPAEPITEIEVPVEAPKSPKPVAVLDIPSEEPLPAAEEEIQENVEQTTANNPAPRSNELNANSDLRSTATNMARRHLNSFHQQQQTRLAEQAARSFQQQKNSPIIDAPLEDSFLSEDEKFRETLKVRADCSSTSKKTAAVVLGFLGGNIDCSDPPPINGFIQKRMNKTTHMPQKNRPSTSSRPKSVVIIPDP